MVGKSPVTATDEQRTALKVLAGGVARSEADRARAVLLTLDGWDQRPNRTGIRSARGYSSVLAQRVYARWDRCAAGECCSWTCAVQGGGCTQGRRASSVAAGRGPDQLDAGAPRRRDRGPRGHKHFALAALQSAAPKRGSRFRRPRHTLKGRQIANEIDRVGLRLKLCKAQAEAGDIVLLFADESEALTHPYLARGANVCGRPGLCKKNLQ